MSQNLKPSKWGVSPFEAVKLAFKNYANFSGRSSQSEYWWYTIIMGIIPFIIICILIYLLYDAAIRANHGGHVSRDEAVVIGLWFIVLGLYSLVLFVPSLAITWRRLHDTGRSGAWYFICFVPYVGGLILFVFTLLNSEMYENEYGTIEGQNLPLKGSRQAPSGQPGGQPAPGRYCTKCGAQLQPGAKFCPSCGAPV